MFKVLSIGILMYILYKLVFPAKAIDTQQEQKLNYKGEDQTIDIEYEELD